MPTSDLMFTGGGRERVLSIIRRRGAKAMRISIDPRDGAVRLSLPHRAPLMPAIQWAAGKRTWIEAELAKVPPPQPIVPGMRFLLAGDVVTLDWAHTYARTPQAVWAEPVEALFFFLSTAEEKCSPSTSSGQADRILRVGGPLEQMPVRVLRYLKRLALETLDRETRALAAAHGIVIGKVSVGDPRSRWGSCASGGDIRYSWRLILAPDFVRRATVAHEVAHRIHMDHSRAFHALAAELFGSDPKPARQWLRAHGAALHGFGRDG